MIARLNSGIAARADTDRPLEPVHDSFNSGDAATLSWPVYKHPSFRFGVFLTARPIIVVEKPISETIAADEDKIVLSVVIINA